MGIDLHKNRWHVTIRRVDLELFSASIPGTWVALQRILARYAGHQMQADYEAGLPFDYQSWCLKSYMQNFILTKNLTEPIVKPRALICTWFLGFNNH